MINLDHQTTRMLIGPGRAVGVGNIDVGFGEGTANAGEFPALIQNLENQHLLLHDIKFFLFEEEKGFCRIIHKKANNGIIDRIMNREGQDVDPRLGENGAGARKNPRSIF